MRREQKYIQRVLEWIRTHIAKGFGVREYLVYGEEGNLPVLTELLSTDKPRYKPMELQVTDAAVNTDRHQERCRST